MELWQLDCWHLYWQYEIFVTIKYYINVFCLPGRVGPLWVQPILQADIFADKMPATDTNNTVIFIFNYISSIFNSPYMPIFWPISKYVSRYFASTNVTDIQDYDTNMAYTNIQLPIPKITKNLGYLKLEQNWKSGLV